MTMKICSKCNKKYPATIEYFYKASANKDGFNSWCKDCHKSYNKKYSKEYYQENKDKLLNYQKEYYQENKESVLAYQKGYYEENRSEVLNRCNHYAKNHKNEKRQYDKIYRLKNKSKILQYREDNKEIIAKKKSIYRKNNREKQNIYNHRRKAKAKQLPATLTEEQWISIKEKFNNSCAYCGMTEEEHLKQFGEQLHQEHFIPLSNGGGYTHNNIIPACKSCNSSKWNNNFFDWYPKQEFYSEEKENFILNYLKGVEK